MKSLRRLTILVAGLVLLASAAHGSMKLNFIEVPGDSVTVGFTPAKGGPAFGLKAELNYRHGQTRVEVHFSGKHQPAVLYGGDVTCYVLWAIEPDGTAENLGELRVTGDDASHHFRTPVKRFALLVTAEPYGLVRRPSELVVFSNDPPPSKRKNVDWKAMSFDGFARAPVHTEESIAELKYKKSEPMNLVQARKAFELAGRNDGRGLCAGTLRSGRSGSREGRGTARKRAPRRQVQPGRTGVDRRQRAGHSHRHEHQGGGASRRSHRGTTGADGRPGSAFRGRRADHRHVARQTGRSREMRSGS